MSNHIKRHFNYPSYASKNNISGKVDVFFYIEEDGNIKRIISYNSHPSLQLECIAIIKKLSQLEPGYMNNRPIKVAYYLPITFKLQ
jgi:bla regulator protein BlaR1